MKVSQEKQCGYYITLLIIKLPPMPHCSHCPLVNEWIKKMQYIYTIEYYSAIRKKQILPFATTWMELEDILCSVK